MLATSACQQHQGKHTSAALLTGTSVRTVCVMDQCVNPRVLIIVWAHASATPGTTTYTDSATVENWPLQTLNAYFLLLSSHSCLLNNHSKVCQPLIVAIQSAEMSGRRGFVEIASHFYSLYRHGPN